MKVSPKLKSFLPWLPVLLVLLYQLPEIIRHYRIEGEKIAPSRYFDLISSAPLTFPPQGRSITLFWASWCTPCVIEMNRLKSSVDSGKISPKRIFAINPFEDVTTVKRYLQKNSYPFTFISSPELTELLQIKVTPTIVWTKDGVITSMNSGISLIGIWKAELLLD
jgi:thiol-disulfide isomerase/thioredoxin